MKRINVATSLNSLYLKYTYVMLTSLFFHHKTEEVHVYILYNDLDREDIAALKRLAKQYRQHIQFIYIDQSVFPEELPTTLSWTIEAYFRLLLTDILPEDVDRILYLDVDIIINKPFLSFYETDFEGKLLCVCPDMGLIKGFPDTDNIRAALFGDMITEEEPYFNSGVLLLNMTELRKNYSFQSYLDLAAKLEYKIFAPDQDLLNYMHHGQLKYADEYQYNLIAKIIYNYDFHYAEVVEGATIVHFAGMKPWEGEFVHFDIEQLWWDYAKLTPYYGELLEYFVHGCINSVTIYDSLVTLSNEKKALKAELDKATALCQKLCQMIDPNALSD